MAVGIRGRSGAQPPWLWVAMATTVLPLGGAVLGTWPPWGAGAGLRERAWEIQAVGLALVAAAWVAAATANGII